MPDRPVRVSILGTEYSIAVIPFDKSKRFSEDSLAGYCDDILHEITICDLSTHPDWQEETQDRRKLAQKITLRHEIVHAFLSESGLQENACSIDGPWPRNEEMVDWIAIQGPKMVEVWQEAGVL